jgi:hypothetical protein
MYRWIVAIVLLAVSVSSSSAQGVAARNRAESLTGLNGIHVIVEDVPALAVEAGLTTAGIRSQVEARLLSRGIPILGLGALTMDPRGPSLLVNLNLDLSDPVYFYAIQVQFFQNVALMTGEDILTSSASASTWQASDFARMGKFRINTLPQEINRLVDAFATDYLKHSEGLPQEEETEDEDADEDSGESDPDAGN